PVPVADLADCPPSDTRWRRVCLRRSRLPSGLLQIRRQGVKGLRRSTAEKPNYRRRRLLRACSERPRGHRAREQRDELAAPHSITSSARASSVGEMVIPRATHRLSPLLDQICPRSQIQNQTTRYSNQSNQIAIFPKLATSP